MARRLFACCLVALLFPDDCRSGGWDPEDCPIFCECYPLYGLRWTECRGRRLYSIHTGVNEAVQALDVSNNSIVSLNDYELQEAGLSGLKLLNLSSNAISEIALRAFAGLAHLKVLDLSSNHLYYINSETFVDNRRLEILELAGNNFNAHVPRLRSTSLASLGLAGCRLSHLPPDTFLELPRLRALDLSNNTMILLKSDVLSGITNLGALVLERNPWYCNNDMFELQVHLKNKGVVFKEVCSRDDARVIKPGPKKFEKMIALDGGSAPAGSAILGGAGQLLTRIKSWRNSWKIEETTTTTATPRSKAIPGTGASSSTTWTKSPYLFIVIGFLLGAASSTVATYICLTRRASTTSVANLRHQALRLDLLNTEARLLQHLLRNNDNARRPTTECPGTPPPPYRDVMRHANRYPRPPARSAIFANDSTLDDQRRMHS